MKTEFLKAVRRETIRFFVADNAFFLEEVYTKHARLYFTTFQNKESMVKNTTRIILFLIKVEVGENENLMTFVF